MIFAQAGTGRKNAEAAPTSTKATISSRCAQSRLPPARENPGQRGPAATFNTATFEASPIRPGQDGVEERADRAGRVHRAEADRRAHGRRPGERAQRLHRGADREPGEQVAPVRRRRGRKTFVPERASEQHHPGRRDQDESDKPACGDPTFTSTASAIRRRNANPWKGDMRARVKDEVGRIEGRPHDMCPHRATGNHASSDHGRAPQ